MTRGHFTSLARSDLSFARSNRSHETTRRASVSLSKPSPATNASSTIFITLQPILIAPRRRRRHHQSINQSINRFPTTHFGFNAGTLRIAFSSAAVARPSPGASPTTGTSTIAFGGCAVAVAVAVARPRVRVVGDATDGNESKFEKSETFTTRTYRVYGSV
jgi:hypothetical protein